MMDGMMAPERRKSFLQINICGLSNHSKNAIDAYLEKQKPDVVFLKETKKQIPDNAFTNYTTLSSTPKKSTEWKVSFSLATAMPNTYTGVIRSAMHLEMSLSASFQLILF